MNSSRRFALALAGFILIYLVYGADRLRLGVDFTDEGVYVAWPLRTLFGEPPFSGDPLLTLRPLFNHLSALYRIYPAISLYDLRLIGWTIHLAAFALLATGLFRLSGRGLDSVLAASVPFFVCHILGLAAPSYNSISSDFLLIALSLFTLGEAAATRRAFTLHIAGGAALFVATLAHVGLGLVAAVLGLNEIFRRALLPNLIRLRPTASNAGLLAFAGCWLGYLLHFFASGEFAVWQARSALFRAARVSSLEGDTGRFFHELLAYPFSYDDTAAVISFVALGILVLLAVPAARRRAALAGNLRAGLGLLLVVVIICTFRNNPTQLPAAFALAALVAIAAFALPAGQPVPAGETNLRILLAASLIGALTCATLTYYFSPLRSWISGIVVLPFAFGVGLIQLLRAPAGRLGSPLRIVTTAALALAVACVARDHYGFVYRDGAPGELTATFRAPKFRHLRSTPERTQAIDALYDYLHPQLGRGEPLLAFDDCPMLYFLFDARPAYGLTWAVRYTQSAATHARLDQEFRTHSLPRFAVRTLVDLSNPVWSIAPRTHYDHYPLNATVTSRYELAATIFPFEIWRLRPAAASE